MANEKTVINDLYNEISKMFSKYKDKIATDCASRPFGQKGKCKAMYRITAYTKAVPIVKRRIKQCKNDIWIGEDKCREKMTKVISVYQRKISKHKRELKQLSAITPTRKAHMNSAVAEVDPITQYILNEMNEDFAGPIAGASLVIAAQHDAKAAKACEKYKGKPEYRKCLNRFTWKGKRGKDLHKKVKGKK